MKQRSLALSLGIGAILCLGLFACSPDSATSMDPGKKDASGAGGKGGGGGAGGSSARGGSGGSNAGGSGGSGGSQAGGSQAGGSQAGGSQAGGSQAGGSQAGGSGGGSGGTGGTRDGGPRDVSSSDAVDAPLPNDDVAAEETSSSDDGGVPVVLDGGAVDIVPPDGAIAFDVEEVEEVEIDTTPLDVSADTTEDTAEDSSADTTEDAAEDSATDTDTASDKPDAGNCLEQIIAGGYSIGTLACSQCKESTGQQLSLESQCTTMVDCLSAASCTNKNNPNNCFLGCQNQVSGGSQTETGACVSDLMDAAQCPTQ